MQSAPAQGYTNPNLGLIKYNNSQRTWPVLGHCAATGLALSDRCTAS